MKLIYLDTFQYFSLFFFFVMLNVNYLNTTHLFPIGHVRVYMYYTFIR